MHVIVIGAGLAGVTSAWYLRKAGFEVSVVDRQPAAGLETSFANGGQISVSHPEPWASPEAPRTIWRWLGREDAPLKFRLRAELTQWAWGLRFLGECRQARALRNTAGIAALARFSLQALRALRDETGLSYAQRQAGILHLFFTPDEAARVDARAQALHALGIRARACDPAACERIEPALAGSGRRPLAGLYGIDDESGDAHEFVRGLAERAAAAGVRFYFSQKVEGLVRAGQQVVAVTVRDEAGQRQRLDAQAFVLCAGSYSPLLARQVGERLPIYPVKGYSLTVPVADPARAPVVSLTDEARRVVCSRLGDRIRVAGTAELNGYDLKANPQRSQALVDWLARHFPGAADLERPFHWCGLRPATPSNLPVIGRARVGNLWYNTGHGTLGWTLACGSAVVLVELMNGQRPRVEAFPYWGG